MNRVQLTLLLAACLLLAPACGTFAYNIRTWSGFEAADDADEMEGRWKDEWRSEWNGHSGGLRCMLTREDENAYRARLHSTFAWILSFRHEIVFHVTGQGSEEIEFEGSEDLGQTFGGVYDYRGTVAGDLFLARYEAENGDHGVFEMRRVVSTPR